MVAMDEFANAFGFDVKSSDTWTTLGKVTAVNGSTLSVKLGGSSSATSCEAYCLADVGDIVFVVITDGKARAVAVKGGGNFVKRQPLSTLDLPHDTTTANGYPIVLSDTFANNGQISYMTVSEFNALIHVGTVKTTDISSNVSVATSTNKSIGSISLEAGNWLVFYGLVFAGNSSGIRCAFMYTTADAGANAQWYRETCVQLPPAGSSNTYLRGAFIAQPSSTTSYYLTAWQNSGSAINCTGNIQAMRIG